jgi:hypothetical protein
MFWLYSFDIYSPACLLASTTNFTVKGHENEIFYIQLCHEWAPPYTDRKDIFLIYKEIQMGSGATSYMTNGLLIYMVEYLRIPHICTRKPFLIYEYAPDPICISLYMRKILVSSLSVYHLVECFPH